MLGLIKAMPLIAVVAGGAYAYHTTTVSKAEETIAQLEANNIILKENTTKLETALETETASRKQAENNLKFYVEKALAENLQLNAERKNFESAKQSKNISRSEFLPSITLSGDQTSTTSTNRTNQSGASLADSNSDSESTVSYTHLTLPTNRVV